MILVIFVDCSFFYVACLLYFFIPSENFLFLFERLFPHVFYAFLRFIATLNAEHSMLTTLIEVYSSLGKGIDINCVNDSGNTALHNATAQSHVQMIKTLIQAGSNIAILNSSGNSVLHELARCMATDRENSSLYMKVKYEMLLVSGCCQLIKC